MRYTKRKKINRKRYTRKNTNKKSYKMKVKKGGAQFKPYSFTQLKYVIGLFSDKSNIDMLVEKYGTMDTWILGKQITNFNNLFSEYTFDNVNDVITNWNVSNVTLMENTFYNCTNFNQPLQWNVSNVLKTTNMFYNCIQFNQPLSHWTLTKVYNMENMFTNCISFNQDLSNWIIPSNCNIKNMFRDCESLTFNPPWNEFNVTNCPKCIPNPEVDRNKQKEIQEQIKQRRYDFVDTHVDDNSYSNGDSNIGLNPISREKENIEKWLENEDNVTIRLDDITYCISKIWIEDMLPQMRVVQCETDSSGKTIQQKLHDDVEQIISDEIVTGETNADDLELESVSYVNMGRLGIDNCITSLEAIYGLLDSVDKKSYTLQYVKSISVTPESNVKYSTYKKSYVPSHAPLSIHNDPSLLKLTNLSETVRDYTYQWDQRMNSYLNSGLTDEQYLQDNAFNVHFNLTPYALTIEKGLEKLKRKISDLDVLFIDHSNTSTEPIKVYRGLSLDSPNEIRFGLNKSFVSTSTNASSARSFMTKKCCLLEIIVDPGIPFLSAYAFSKFPEEYEIILPRNLIYTLQEEVTRLTDKIYVVRAQMSTPNQFYQGWNCHNYNLYDIM